MKCPACETELTSTNVGGVAVDVCQGGCGGVWFDAFELKKFDEPREEAGAALLEIERNPDISVDRSKRIGCPRCADTIMMRHFFSVKREIEVDECPACAGFWLDFGELGRIRSLFPSEEQRDKAARLCFQEVFGEELFVMQTRSEKDRIRSSRIAAFFRFVLPSRYIPGDQEWGAF